MLLTLELSDNQATNIIQSWMKADMNVDLNICEDPEVYGFTLDPMGNGGRWTEVNGDEASLYHDSVNWVFEYNGSREALNTPALPVEVLKEADLMFYFDEEETGLDWFELQL